MVLITRSNYRIMREALRLTLSEIGKIRGYKNIHKKKEATRAERKVKVYMRNDTGYERLYIIFRRSSSSSEINSDYSIQQKFLKIEEIARMFRKQSYFIRFDYSNAVEYISFQKLFIFFLERSLFSK